MLDLIYCEILKLKRSKIVLFSIVSILATPLLMLVEALQTHFKHPEQIFTLYDIYESSLLYVMLLMNMMVYVAITAYLFSREYTEKTLKTILPIPVSRVDFITGKFLILFIWTNILSILTWLAILIMMFSYHLVFGLNGFGIQVALEWLIKYIFGNTLMFLTLTPFAYLAEKSKGFVIPIIISAAVVMGSAAISNQDFGILYPWVGTMMLANGSIQSSPYPMPLVLAIIGFVSILGFFMTYTYFSKEDIK